MTSLIWIGPRPRAQIEKNLGYGPGRLAMGHWVLLLKDTLTPDDFHFAGTTLRSGGRHGLPAATWPEDGLRGSVHGDILAERGQAGYRALQMHELAQVPAQGTQRVAKVCSVIQHDEDIPLNIQYPMGGGGLQWRLVRDKKFLVAMKVEPDGTAVIPGRRISLAETLPYLQLLENRTQVMNYLKQA